MDRDIVNITNEIEAIEKQIEMFSKLLQSDEISTYSNGNELYPLSGLNEEDFYSIRESIINMLNDMLDKKYKELRKLCDKKLNKCKETKEIKSTDSLEFPVGIETTEEVSIDINKIGGMSSFGLVNHLVGLYSGNSGYKKYYKEDGEFFNDYGIAVANKLKNEIMNRMS